MMYNKKREYIQARRDDELDGIGNLMKLYKFNGKLEQPALWQS